MTTPTLQPHTFSVSRWKSGDPLVSMTIGEQSELSEVIEAFKLFLVAIGYMLPDGASLGFEYDDDVEENN